MKRSFGAQMEMVIGEVQQIRVQERLEKVGMGVL